MKTLRKLQQTVEVAPPIQIASLPTPGALKKSGACVVDFKSMSDKSILLAYDTGYVLYDNGMRNTVLRLHDINGDYCYHPCSGIIIPDMCICGDEILEMPWYLGPILVAEDRIVHNQNNSATNQKVFPVGIASDEMFGLMDSASDPLEQIIQHQDLLDTITSVNYALSNITEDQRRVVIEYFSGDEKKKEVAERLGMTPQLLNYYISRGLHGMRKALGVKEKI